MGLFGHSSKLKPRVRPAPAANLLVSSVKVSGCIGLTQLKRREHVPPFHHLPLPFENIFSLILDDRKFHHELPRGTSLHSGVMKVYGT